MLKEAERVILAPPPLPPAPVAPTAFAPTALSAAPAVVAAAPAVVAATPAVIAAAPARGGKRKGRGSGATPWARKPPAAEVGIWRLPGLRRFAPEARITEETPCCAKIVLFQIDKEIEPAPVFSYL
jgi:hypothetical protein